MTLGVWRIVVEHARWRLGQVLIVHRFDLGNDAQDCHSSGSGQPGSAARRGEFVAKRSATNVAR
ncbi:MAG: hypothetical protein QM756_10615 [Polyangiaceae bacterium]